MNYKLCLIGTKDTTAILGKYILDNIMKIDCIITIDDDSVNSNSVSGFYDMEKFAREHDIYIHKALQYDLQDEKSKKFFGSNYFEIAICMGWQRLIPKYVLDSFEFGIFGFHGSCGYLPYGRGRSPLNWSLINGDSRFILNLFKYDEYPDSPNVYTKRMFEINEFDTVRTLQMKNLLCSYDMITQLVNDYNKKTISIRSESKDFDFVYLKRNPSDGKIDFKMKTREIYNLIRGVTHPFPGAFCYVRNEKIVIWSAKPFDFVIDFSNYRPGEVIDILDDYPIIRTVDGSLIVTDYQFGGKIKKGDYLI